MKTRIISAFPGSGKSYYHNQHKETTLDSDSSNFSWVKDKNGNNTTERNTDFPENYIEHIKKNIGKYEFIFVSSHKVVRDALKYNCLFFYLLYPPLYDKDKYIQRYKDRGSPDGFIKLLDSKFEEWIHECSDEIFGCESIEMFLGTFEDELKDIIEYEDELCNLNKT